MQRDKLVVYHNHCQDGFFSAHLFWKMFGDSAIYKPVLHRPIIDVNPIQALELLLKDSGIEICDLINYDLYVVDFCFPVEHIEIYKNIFKSILTLDHHESAFLDYKDKYPYTKTVEDWAIFQISDTCKIIISQHESAVVLAYKYFYPNMTIPWYLELISDNDLMKNSLPNTEIFYHGVTLYKPYKFECIEKLIQNDFKDIMKLGSLVKRNRIGIIEEIITSQLTEITCEEQLSNTEYLGVLINSELTNASDLGTYILNVIKKYDFIIIYNIRKDDRVHCSLRSNDKFNSLLIAEHFGGGGHRLSGGCSMSIDQLTKIIEDKKLII